MSLERDEIRSAKVTAARSPPLVGEGGGEGYSRVRRLRLTPLPNPPPQGGREHKKRRPPLTMGRDQVSRRQNRFNQKPSRSIASVGRIPALMGAEGMARNDLPHDLGGAVENPAHAGFPPDPLDRQVLRIARSAEQLQGAVGDALDHLGAGIFRQRRGGGAGGGVAPVVAPCRFI